MKVYETESVYRLILKWKGSIVVVGNGVELFPPDNHTNWWARVHINLKRKVKTI